MNHCAVKKPRFGGAFLCLLMLLVVMPATGHGQSVLQVKSPPTVLITGSNRGIGLEFTRQYAALDWRVIATCREPDKAAELTKLLRRYPNITIEQLDLTDHDAIDGLAEKYRDMPIDVLLNNAALLGDTQGQLFGELDYEQYEDILAVNVIGTLKVSEAFLGNVIASRQKKIIALGSAAGSNGLLGPVANLYAYRSSKAALHLAMHNLALDLAERNVIVGLINPGLVDTRGVLDLQPGDAVPEVFKPLLPLIESGQLELMRPVESVAAMVGLIGTLSVDQSGQFLNFDGTVLPW
jgi:NAD(P)-dependent dehydrogenase (short-subunit alcohol dehydrogenase family)